MFHLLKDTVEIENNLLWVKSVRDSVFSMWFNIVLLVLVLSSFGYFLYKRIKLRLIKFKIRKMKADERALVELEKKTQEDRFKNNKISGLIYDIRMKKYKEKLSKIKAELPILESKARKV